MKSKAPTVALGLMLAGCGGATPPAPQVSDPPEPRPAPPVVHPAAARSTAPAPAAPAPLPAPAPSPAKPRTVTARHVLVQWMGCERAPAAVVRTREQALVLAADVLKQARAGADFARLAVDYSDEPGAAARGGSIGRFGSGQMAQAFEQAAFALAPGEVSGVVETPFGFHIIQRTE